MELRDELNGRVVFLDRDGVLNEKLEGDYVKSVDELKIFPEAFEALKLLRDNGYRLILITNQRGIARGLMTHEVVIHGGRQRERHRGGAAVRSAYGEHQQRVGSRGL